MRDSNNINLFFQTLKAMENGSKPVVSCQATEKLQIKPSKKKVSQWNNARATTTTVEY